MKLRVWHDAVAFYHVCARLFRQMPYELKRVAAKGLASSDSIHRNIAEGYCRRSVREYIQHLYVALGSLGESVSGLHAYHSAGQISASDFEEADELAYRLENGLLRLVEALERKRDSGGWVDTLVVRECNAAYEGHDGQDNPVPVLHHSTTPSLPC
jgi:four helix bundle protein